MSKYCPEIHGLVLYADCLECENRKECKLKQKIDTIQNFLSHAEEMKRRSKIYQTIRNRKIDKNIYSFKVGMACSGYGDMPEYYDCNIYGYEFTYFSNQKEMTLFKKKWFGEGCISEVNLNYYYYFSPGAKNSGYVPNIQIKNSVELIDQEELARLANKDWTKTKGVSCETDIKLMKLMKIKYINTLVYHKEIIYSEKQKKYVSYRIYNFCNGDY